MSSITTTSVSTATANVQSQVQPAAQSIINGSTGNAAMNVSSLVSNLASALVNAETADQPGVKHPSDGLSGDSTST